jgi:Bacterial Ig-like domain (group 1)
LITLSSIIRLPNLKLILALIFSAGLAACGGGGSETPPGSGGNNNGGGSGGGTTTTPTASLAVSLVDPASGAPKSAISSGSPGVVKALVKDKDGNPVSGAVVTFSTDKTLANFSPTSGTALTDGNGQASVTIVVVDVNAAGAATISATAQVGTEAPKGSTGFAIGATAVTLSNITIGQNPLSAKGTTSISVTVLSNGSPVTTPLTVNFSSGCAGAGKAVLTPSVTTNASGVATASYRDINCATNDAISVNLSGIATTVTASLTVRASNTGSIQFVSATPTQITLKGTGGAGKSESSLISFKVLDEGGSVVGGKIVSFVLSTTVGGIELSSSSAVSDPTTGLVFTNVKAGTISTPIRVLATTTNSKGDILATQSDQLTITTGVPTQTSFSAGPLPANIEGWEYDGISTPVTARLADHFSNPPPAGTVVNFIAEGGKISASCSTVESIPSEESGVCVAKFTSQNFRPANGRVTVLAYAVGEEWFTDINGDGFVNGRDELVDSDGQETVGFGEAFVDFNENFIRDATEPFVDFDGNLNYLPPLLAGTGLYKGILCKSPNPLCDPSKTLHIRQDLVIVLSGSHPVISGQSQSGGPISEPVDLTSGSTTLFFRISDLHGNAMPAGTKITFEGSNTVILAKTGEFTVSSTTACMDLADRLFRLLDDIVAPGLCPASARNTGPFTYSATIGSPTAATVPDGTFTITVTTPQNISTSISFSTKVKVAPPPTPTPTPTPTP